MMHGLHLSQIILWPIFDICFTLLLDNLFFFSWDGLNTQCFLNSLKRIGILMALCPRQCLVLRVNSKSGIRKFMVTIVFVKEGYFRSLILFKGVWVTLSWTLYFSWMWKLGRNWNRLFIIKNSFKNRRRGVISYLWVTVILNFSIGIHLKERSRIGLQHWKMRLGNGYLMRNIYDMRWFIFQESIWWRLMTNERTFF